MSDLRSLTAQYREFKPFELRSIEGGTEFVFDGSSVATIYTSDDACLLHSKHGHVHCEDEDEAVAALGAFLASRARWVEEWRGETLASSWVETHEDDSWVRRDAAIFLTPFDADEWTARAGERWRVVRTTWSVSPESRFAESSTEQTGDEPFGRPDSLLAVLDEALGPAAAGMKWTVGRDNRLVAQIPKGWRRAKAPQRDQVFVDFAPEQPGLILRLQNYYRTSATPVPERTTSVKPTLREYDRQDATRESEGWACDTWTLTFMGDQDDMLVMVQLFEHESAPGSAEPFRRLLADTVGEARYVPNDWKMAEER